jgi:hypothetical protein
MRERWGHLKTIGAPDYERGPSSTIRKLAGRLDEIPGTRTLVVRSALPGP